VLGRGFSSFWLCYWRVGRDAGVLSKEKRTKTTGKEKKVTGGKRERTKRHRLSGPAVWGFSVGGRDHKR